MLSCRRDGQSGQRSGPDRCPTGERERREPGLRCSQHRAMSQRIRAQWEARAQQGRDTQGQGQGHAGMGP